ncbi:MAG: hypothetical protein H6706_23935 [Myxococcales bacterium]|nr:hypothetical protein [Myxococcales bacterium]
MIRLLVALQVLTLAGLGWLAFRDPTTADGVLAGAEEARATGLEAEDRFAEAALAWERAARGLPGPEGLRRLDAARRAQALAVVAAPALPTGREVDTLWALRAALEAAGDRPTAELLSLALQRADGRRADALETLERLRAAGETSPWLLWHAGGLRLEESRLVEAQELLEALVKAKPAFGAGWHRLGLTYLAGGRPEAATEALIRATRAGAGAEAELDLGRLFLKREMWAEGIPHLENALRGRQPPGVAAEALRLLGAAHFHLKRPELAAETYRKAFALEPEPRTLLSAAIALTTAGRHAEAAEALQSLAPRAPEVPEILFQQAVVAAALQQPTGPILERYLALARGNPGEKERVAQAEAALRSQAAPAAP